MKNRIEIRRGDLVLGSLPETDAMELGNVADVANTANTRAVQAVKDGVRDDAVMLKTFGAVYDCLPRPVCRFISEERFVAFCLEHRKRLLE